MNRKLGSALVATALGLAMLAPASPVSAQTAYSTSFQTSITYQNVGSDSATVNFKFYQQGSSTPITVSRTLARGAGASLFVGGLTELSSFTAGSVVVESTQPIVATAVQIPSGSSQVRNRPLSNGFERGGTRQLLATVLKNRFNSTTKFSVQNTGSTAANGTVRFFNADAGGAEVTAARQTITNLPAGSAVYYDAGAIAALPSGFNGSATVEVTSGEVVLSALELGTNSGNASAFEGIERGSRTVYMPSALCNAFGGQNSSYAVQNTSSSTASITVTYSNGRSQTKTAGPGGKASFVACDAGVGNGFNGSATITANQDIVAIAKIYGQGLYTAALGASSGASRLALPYVRWSETRYTTGERQRAFIAIQNVGGNLPAGSVKVHYVDINGNIVGTHTINTAIPTGAKVNSNPSMIGNAGSEFGYVGGFGGSAIVEGPAGSQLTAVVRVASQVGGVVYGEDYNGIAIP